LAAFSVGGEKKVSCADAELISEVLHRLSDTAMITENHITELGSAMAKVLPPNPEAPVWATMSAWEATAHAVAFLGFAHRIRSEAISPADERLCLDSFKGALKEWRASIHEGGNYMDSILGTSTTHFAEAVEVVQSWVAAKIETASTSKKEALLRAIDSLEDIAGGKAGKMSWKENLSSESSWDDVCREANYNLVDLNSVHLHSTLDARFKQMEEARAEYTKVMGDLAYSRITEGVAISESAMPAQITSQITSAMRKADITHTESYFYEAALAAGPDRARKIQRRIESMTTREIASEEIQSALWRKVLIMSTQRAARRVLPLTPVPGATA
jgi:hypothetical protein